MKKIILASTSPRRRELMTQAGYNFEVISPECDENIEIDDPSAFVEELSLRKCTAGSKMISDSAVIIGADTVVACDGKILGKPHDKKEAFSMLKSLSGKTHSVFTGVTVIDNTTQTVITFHEKTDVVFYEVDDDEIQWYVDTQEPMDKAGAYGIQGKGVFLVRKINGDYNNVVGLPVAHLIRVMKQLGCRK